MNCEYSKAFSLIGSQISLTSRSDKTVLPVCNGKCRPCSATSYCRTQTEPKTQSEDCTRPKSADSIKLNSSNCESIQWSFSPSENKLPGDSSLTVSDFINSSSKLLQNLLESSNYQNKNLKSEERNPCAKNFSKTSSNLGSEVMTKEKYIEKTNKFVIATNSEFRKSFQEDNNTYVKKNENLESPEVQSRLSEIVEEKTVTFLERDRESYPKKELRLSEEEAHICSKWIKTSDKAKVLQLEARTTNTVDLNEINKLSPHFHEEAEIFNDKQKYEGEIFRKQGEGSPNENVKFEGAAENPKKIIEKSDLQPVYAQIENKPHEKYLELRHRCGGEYLEKRSDEIDKENAGHDSIDQKLHVPDSTYEEIVRLLQTLDEEDSESLNLETREDATAADPMPKMDHLSSVSSYLEKIETENDSLQESYLNTGKWKSSDFNSPRLEELLNKNSVELAHEVFSLKIQLEDQRKGIKLLKDTLEEMKEAKKIGELKHQEALHKVTSETETLVQRHQKFIKQLLNEKKNLNETVSKLVQDLKSGEERYKKNLKAMEEKHLIEIKRAKEVQAVAEKIKREKWMETKTKKIKEMTFKGLEPELSRMAARQQEEIMELRNLHKAELEAIELRAARRNSDLMDELRAELTKEKERAIAKETATLRANMEKEFENDKKKLQKYCQTLKECISKQEEKLSNQELEFQQRLIDYKQEEERKKQKIVRDHQENLEEAQRQHLIELKNLRESLELEQTVFLNNYKKEQAAKFLEREAQLHQEYKRERDKEIEMVIEALEKESAKIQSGLNTTCENKLKKLKDKMEAEIKEIEASEAALKVKVSEFKTKMSEKEDLIMELSSQNRQLQGELTYFKQACDDMNLEKTKLKEIIREEFQSNISNLVKEKENLEKEISALKESHSKELAKKDQQSLQAKCEMQKELTKICSRIKTAVNKKEKIIDSLREENRAANQRCRQLEFLLDQQRRNLLL